MHRDIKPSNLKITPAGVLKLVDFGLVKIMSPDQEMTITVIQGLGTALYTPLEQYGSDETHTDTRSDIYSYGATLYHLLTNESPVDAAQTLHPAGKPASAAADQSERRSQDREGDPVGDGPSSGRSPAVHGRPHQLPLRGRQYPDPPPNCPGRYGGARAGFLRFADELGRRLGGGKSLASQSDRHLDTLGASFAYRQSKAVLFPSPIVANLYPASRDADGGSSIWAPPTRSAEGA